MCLIMSNNFDTTSLINSSCTYSLYYRQTSNANMGDKVGANRINRKILWVVQSKSTLFLNFLSQFVSNKPRSCCCPLPVNCYICVLCFSRLLLQLCHPVSA